jgi:hypothetical protein
MTNEACEELPEHDCPFEHSEEASSGSQSRPPTGEPCRLYITDGAGTWHQISALRLVALNSGELEQLEDHGDERVLDRCVGVRLLDILKPNIPADGRLRWT